jgi:hypothetical protein
VQRVIPNINIKTASDWSIVKIANTWIKINKGILCIKCWNIIINIKDILAVYKVVLKVIKNIVTYLHYVGRSPPPPRWRGRVWRGGPVQDTPFPASGNVTGTATALPSNTCKHDVTQQVTGNGIKAGGQDTMWLGLGLGLGRLVSYEWVWIVKSPSPVKCIVIEFYKNDYRRSKCDTADGSTCVILNCISGRANVE